MGVTEKETLYNKHDFDEINIPAPQKKEDGKIEIPNLTAEDIFKQILLHLSLIHISEPTRRS
mgnify:CR=1 FL=1